MGSLRWWTEVVLRGMDEFVCDPTEDDSRCPKIKVADSKISCYCVSCLIFGATGLRRSFKSSINGGEGVFEGRPIVIKPKERHRGWYLGSGLKGSLELNLIPLDNRFDENLVLVPLAIASNWGGIGAKTQHGYGVMEFEEPSEINFKSFEDALNRIKESRSSKNIKLRKENTGSLPNMQETFFAKVQFEANRDWWKNVDGIKGKLEMDNRVKKWVESGSVPVVPAIKNWLRYGNGKELWEKEESNNRRLENWLFGSIRNYKSASKINISCAYITDHNRWEYRIWGWIPKNNSPRGFCREDFLHKFKASLDGRGSVKFPWEHLFGNGVQRHKLNVWHEFASSRDTTKPNEKEIESYLQTLLNGKGEGNEH